MTWQLGIDTDTETNRQCALVDNFSLVLYGQRIDSDLVFSTLEFSLIGCHYSVSRTIQYLIKLMCIFNDEKKKHLLLCL